MERHRFDPVAFMFGTVFLAIGVVFVSKVEIGSVAPEWLLPSALTAVGLLVAGVTLSRLQPRSRGEEELTDADGDEDVGHDD